MVPFRKIHSNNKDVMNLQSNVDEVFRSVAVTPFLDGVLIQDVALATAGTVVNHGLQRQPRGWVVVDSTAAATFYRSAWSDRSLTLVPSANTTVSLWVF